MRWEPRRIEVEVVATVMSMSGFGLIRERGVRTLIEEVTARAGQLPEVTAMAERTLDIASGHSKSKPAMKEIDWKCEIAEVTILISGEDDAS